MTAKKAMRAFSTILTILMLLTMSACTERETLKNIEDCYKIHTNSDLTYSYKITDFKGNVLFSESAAIKPPNIKPLSPSVLEVSAQAGTGLSTNWAIYCDVETGKTSEKFFYVLGAKDGYVLYVKYEDKVHTIICRNIFDSKALTQEYRVDDELVVLDSFSKADFKTEGVATISYASGDTAIRQEYIHIYFPD